MSKAASKGETRPGNRGSRPFPADFFRVRPLHLLLVFLIALAFRGLYLWEASERVDFNIFYMDQEYHLGWAKALATGDWPHPFDRLQGVPFFRAPLYAWFLAAQWRLFGEDLLLFRVIQVVIGALSATLAAAVAARCFGRRVGFLAGLFCSVYWVFAYFEGEFLIPVLLVFFLQLAILVTFLAFERDSVPYLFLAGTLFGLYAITRPNILLFYPLALWWVHKTTRGLDGNALRNALVFAAGLVILPAAVTTRNAVVGRDAVVIASQGGVNFYIGNNPGSNGMQAVVPGTRQTWWGGFEDTKAIAEEAMGRPLKPSEISDYWYRRAFEYIADQPGHWMRLTLRKIVAFVGNVEPVNNEPYEARRGRYRSLSAVPLDFGVFAGLFLVSLPLWSRGRSFRRCKMDKREAFLRGRFALFLLLLLITYSVTVVLFFVAGRYRVPLVPILAVGASLAVVDVWDRVRSGRLGQGVAITVCAALIVGLLHVDYLDVRARTSGFARLTDAQDRLSAGQAGQAAEILEGILQSRSVEAPEVYLSLIRSYVALGRSENKAEISRVALEGAQRYPEEPELLWYASMTLVESSRWTEAGEMLRQYRTLRPGDPRACFLAFNVAIHLGSEEDARSLLEEARRLSPNGPEPEAMERVLESRYGVRP